MHQVGLKVGMPLAEITTSQVALIGPPMSQCAKVTEGIALVGGVKLAASENVQKGQPFAFGWVVGGRAPVVDANTNGTVAATLSKKSRERLYPRFKWSNHHHL